MKKSAAKLKHNSSEPGHFELPFLALLLVVMIFLLMAWGIWWYFDWKIEMLDRQTIPPTTDW